MKDLAERGRIFFYAFIREIYMAFYETNCKRFRKRVLLSPLRDRLCSSTGKGKAEVKKISEISRIAGVSKRTLQFYDDEGMLKVKRNENNHRLYDEKSLDRLWEIMPHKEMGLELGEIKQLLELTENEKKGYYKVYIGQIEEEIKKLESKKRFISLIIVKGLPGVPEVNAEMTYKRWIGELREKGFSAKD